MAARIHLSHLERTRQKIQASMLINRLTDFINNKVELNAAQVTAALGLIRKVVPDLSAVEMDMNANVAVAQYDLDVLNDRELNAVERALVKAAVAGGSESGAGEEEAGSLH
jgi:uncharacterized protein with von Willebrand factor type A (vWA) domain